MTGLDMVRCIMNYIYYIYKALHIYIIYKAYKAVKCCIYKYIYMMLGHDGRQIDISSCHISFEISTFLVDFQIWITQLTG